MAHCLVSLGLVLIGPNLVAVSLLDALDLDILHVLVLAVVAEPEESFLELDKLESWEVFRVTNQDDALLLGSKSLKGIPQWWFCLQESEREELKFSLKQTLITLQDL